MDPVSGVSSILTSPVNFNPLLNHNKGMSPALQVELARLQGVSQLFEPISTLPGFTGVVPSTAVELSGLGSLLSSLDTFQTRIAAVRQATTPVAGQPATLASVATTVQNFAQAFNGLGGTVNALTAFTGPLNGDFTATQLSSQLNNVGNQLFGVTNSKSVNNAITNPNPVNTAAPLTTLAQIGLNFQPAATFGAVGTFTVNPPALQTAFNANPAGTTNVLNLAAQALSQQVAGFTGPGGILPGVMQSLQWGMMFGAGLANGVSNLQGTPFTGPDAMAVQQYARIAALAPMTSFVGGESSKGLFA